MAALGLCAPATAQSTHSHRYDVAHRLVVGLQGTPLARYAFLFESEGHRWNINPFLVAGISGTESSFGAAACGGNAWGIASCGVTFPSFADGIRYTTKLLRTFYLDLGYTTLDAVGGRYAACGSCWAAHTRYFMQSRFQSDDTLTYPLS